MGWRGSRLAGLFRVSMHLAKLGYRKRTSDMGGNRFAREEVGAVVSERITVEVCEIDKISVVDNDASYLKDDTEERRVSKRP